jgi:hypothetical protein
MKTNKTTTFRIYQSFETLGDPCAETATTAAEAAAIAARMVEEIAEMIAGGMSAPRDEDARTGRTGSAGELAAWDAAHEAAGEGNHLTVETARIVARAAVQIEEIPDPEA